MITNMTFTKGIGTPTYMSPEILNKQHYKKPSDIFSFSIIMYEVMKWGIECNANFKELKYPKDNNLIICI